LVPVALLGLRRPVGRRLFARGGCPVGLSPRFSCVALLLVRPLARFPSLLPLRRLPGPGCPPGRLAGSAAVSGPLGPVLAPLSPCFAPARQRSAQGLSSAIAVFWAPAPYQLRRLLLRSGHF